ncbi:sensor histidine kinase [Pseudoalteromonas sp. S3785]|uniref:sensor histidine kinase n=1 Tax=Pseudoalteromonas sp. S3785 TaxID=579545 RepID=UPI00110A16D4|nr:sensor histidine kinase [Pseudoalteromonas sp. S3785]TMO77324.1 sensor histidine kinase [Pseudoalteromonas sp. S3785]
MSTTNTLSKPSNKKFWEYAPLIFTGFYLLPTLFNLSNLPVNTIVMSVAFYIVFILLYIKAMHCETKHITTLFIVMLLVCFSATFYTTGTSTLYGFIAFIAGESYVKKSRLYAVFSLIFTVALSAYLADIENIKYFLAGTLLISGALLAFGIATQKERLHKKREQESANQLEQLAAIAERERIARDLHDILGHSLSSIALKAELANKLNQGERYEQANNEIAQVADLARQLLSDVRNAVSDLKQLNLISQIVQLKQRLIEQDFNVNFNVVLNTLPPKVEGIAGLIIKEAVTNLLRHSSNKNCEIHIEQTQHQLHISVVDNAPCSTLNAGNGLNGIKERAEQLNGHATFTCGDKFTLNVMLPISAKD